MADNPFRVSGDRTAPPVVPVTLYPDGKHYPITEDHPLFVRAGQNSTGSVGMELGGVLANDMLTTQEEIRDELRKVVKHLEILTEVRF